MSDFKFVTGYRSEFAENLFVGPVEFERTAFCDLPLLRSRPACQFAPMAACSCGIRVMPQLDSVTAYIRRNRDRMAWQRANTIGGSRFESHVTSFGFRTAIIAVCGSGVILPGIRSDPEGAVRCERIEAVTARAYLLAGYVDSSLDRELSACGWQVEWLDDTVARGQVADAGTRNDLARHLLQHTPQSTDSEIADRSGLSVERVAVLRARHARFGFARAIQFQNGGPQPD